jgi:hypothetical protein
VEYVDEFVEAPPLATPQEDAFYLEEPAATPAAGAASDEFFITDPEPAPPVPAPSAPPAQVPAPAAAPARAPAPSGAAADASPARPPAEAETRNVPAREAPGARSAPHSAPQARKTPAAAATRPRASAEPRRPAAAAPTRRPAPGASRTGRYAVLAAVALAVLAAGGFLASRMLSAPSLESLSPQRAKIGQVVTLAGRHFAASREGNRVLFGDRPGTLVSASPTRIEVEVPELPTSAGKDVTVPVSVETGGRGTGALELAVYQSPRIHGLSPDVGMPGDELTLAGSGWGPGAEVRFGARPADLVMTSATALRVRVPALEEAPGTSVPVTVAIGGDRSNEAPFVIGRLPLVQGAAPTNVAAGDMVTLKGRGFHAEAQRNSVSIAGQPALVIDSSGGELRVMVPFVPAGDAALELRVPGSADAARVALSVSATRIRWRGASWPSRSRTPPAIRTRSCPRPSVRPSCCPRRRGVRPPSARPRRRGTSTRPPPCCGHRSTRTSGRVGRRCS